jgi:hypothetical protein
MKLNHLKTFETYTNEEFNPFKGEDWKGVGNAVRKGAGFLTPEELVQKGKQMIARNPKYKVVYDKWLQKDSEAAQKFITFIAEHPDAMYFNYEGGKWSETGIRNWGEGSRRVRS